MRTNTAIAATFIFLFFFFCLQMQWVNAEIAEKNQTSVLYLRIEGNISPAEKDLLNRAIQQAEKDEYNFLMLGIDTPGGLGTSMRNMVKSILNARIPVITWVGPKGARAASAGVFLVASSTVASMSPQTNIGSASPVKMGDKEMSSTMKKKIKNDFLGLIRGLAESKNRNVAWYEKAVQEAANITASTALQKNVIDMLADSPRDLMAKLAKSDIKWQGKQIQFSEKNISIEQFEPGFRHGFLSWILHPQIAYFLLLGGLAGLFFELSNPGAIFPGAFGGLCLLLGLYAMSILPTNVAGLLLIVLSLILFILELAITSYGLLALGGLFGLFMGSVILFRFEYGFMQLSLQSILPAVLAVGLVIFLGVYLVTQAQIKPQSTGAQGMLGLEGTVIDAQDKQGRAKIRGEIWNVSSSHPLYPGTKIKVNAIDGLNLSVEPIFHKQTKE